MTDDGAEIRGVQNIRINLNVSGVVGPTYRAALSIGEIIAISLPAITAADLSAQVRHPDVLMAAQFEQLPPAEDRRSAYVRWVLIRAFQDLARAVHESLEEAFLFLELLQLREPALVEDVHGFLEGIRRRANRLNLPQLLDEVNARVGRPLAWSAETLSVQKVRNCLEHRAGVVGVQDANDQGELVLSLPAMRLLIVGPDGPRDVVFGEPVEEGGRLQVVVDRRVRIYQVGQQVDFSVVEASEFVMAAFLFAADLEGALNEKLQPRNAEGK